MPNEKFTVIRLIVGLIKKIYKISYFPEPYTRSKNKIKDENYYPQMFFLKNVNTLKKEFLLMIVSKNISKVNIAIMPFLRQQL